MSATPKTCEHCIAWQRRRKQRHIEGYLVAPCLRGDSPRHEQQTALFETCGQFVPALDEELAK